MQYMRSGKIAIAVALTGVALIAGCSSSGVKGTSSAALPASAPHGAAGSVAAGAAHSGAGSGKSAAGSSGGSGQSVSAHLAPASQELIYTADLTVRAHNITKATTQATQIVTSVGGYVSNENTSADPANPTHSTASLTLKIPVSSYATTLSQLTSQLGTRTQQAQDVTQQVADTNSQVTSAEAAITQLRALLSHAGSVNDLLNVQNQINTEESQLEALQAQQSALNHETTYATVNLTLLGPKAAAPAHHPKSAPGLGRGLTAGWHALRVTVTWTLAVLGAAAPFLAVIALVAYLAYQGRRRLIRRRAHPQPTAPE